MGVEEKHGGLEAGGGWQSVIGVQLSAFSFRLSAFGFQFSFSAFGVQLSGG
jgi:hypothetical protein